MAIIVPAVAWGEGSGDVRAGERFARDTCATCHGVGKGQMQSPDPAAPPFEAIAAVPGIGAEALRSALTSPHHRMPNVDLAPDALADVVAYMLSLKR